MNVLLLLYATKESYFNELRVKVSLLRILYLILLELVGTTVRKLARELLSGVVVT